MSPYSNKPFDLMLSVIKIRIRDFLTDFLPLRDWDNCKNFAWCLAVMSYTLGDVCALTDALLVW